MALHFNRLPTELDPDQLNDYLYLVKQEHNTPSNAYFKFTVYALRYVFRMEGLKDKRIELPALRRDRRLPVVLSKPEVKRLIAAPVLLKHRVLLATLYGCGLRNFELCNLKLADLDFDRRMLHVRQGKGGKDRYVPLSQHLVRGLGKYIQAESPQTWLFNGQVQEGEQGLLDRRYNTAGVQWVVRAARKQAGIHKQVTPHTLRHTFATHLLEDGLDIVSIKDLLGHEPRVPGKVRAGTEAKAASGRQGVGKGAVQKRVGGVRQGPLLRARERGGVPGPLHPQDCHLQPPPHGRGRAVGELLLQGLPAGGAQLKLEMKLEGMEFIRRFALHILPRGFVRIRHYGILSGTSKAVAIPAIREQLPQEKKPKAEARQVQEYNPLLCPCCRKETMVTLQVVPKRGPPQGIRTGKEYREYEKGL